MLFLLFNARHLYIDQVRSTTSAWRTDILYNTVIIYQLGAGLFFCAQRFSVPPLPEDVLLKLMTPTPEFMLSMCISYLYI